MNMRSIKNRFKNIAEQNPYWSSYICFAETVRGQGFNKKTLYKWFDRLVEKGDYSKTDKVKLLQQLYKLSND